MFRVIGKLIKFIFTLTILLAIMVALVIGYARFIEPHRLTTTEVNYQSPLIEKEVRIAVFADTHFGFEYNLDDFQKVIDKVNDSPPDILLFCGDLIDNLNQYSGSTSEISKALAKMKAKSGKYAVFGNHDYGGGAENRYEGIMNAGGFKVLKNEIVSFDAFNLNIIGIDDLLIGYGDPKIANHATSDKYNFVMCHEPDVVDKITSPDIKFMMAGHTHGGQIRVPFYTAKFLPSYGEKYVKGEYDLNGIKIYVTSGLGTTKIPARLFAPPELTNVTLSPE